MFWLVKNLALVLGSCFFRLCFLFYIACEGTRLHAIIPKFFTSSINCALCLCNAYHIIFYGWHFRNLFNLATAFQKVKRHFLFEQFFLVKVSCFIFFPTSEWKQRIWICTFIKRWPFRIVSMRRFRALLRVKYSSIKCSCQIKFS